MKILTDQTLNSDNSLLVCCHGVELRKKILVEEVYKLFGKKYVKFLWFKIIGKHLNGLDQQLC